MLWSGTPLGIRLHPVQLYLCALELALCAGLLWWLPQRRQAGEMAGGWLLLSGLGQFFLDLYRGNNRLMVFGAALSLTQAIDFCMVVLGGLLLLEHGHASTKRRRGEVRA
jgi:phosphatidylglycerol:prolipoprotein diacylglycerol transferase